MCAEMRTEREEKNGGAAICGRTSRDICKSGEQLALE